MQDNEDPVRFKGHHSSSGSNKSPNHRRRAHGNITHTDPRAHLGIRLGLFKAQRLIYSRSRRGGGGGGLTCAVLSFAFALAALRIRPPSLQQQRQQAGGHQAPDDPAGTPAMPRRAWQHREKADPTCRRRRDAALGCRFRWKAQLNPGCSRRRLAHTVPHRLRAQRGEGGGMCGYRSPDPRSGSLGGGPVRPGREHPPPASAPLSSGRPSCTGWIRLSVSRRTRNDPARRGSVTELSGALRLTDALQPQQRDPDREQGGRAGWSRERTQRSPPPPRPWRTRARTHTLSCRRLQWKKLRQVADLNASAHIHGRKHVRHRTWRFCSVSLTMQEGARDTLEGSVSTRCSESASDSFHIFLLRSPGREAGTISREQSHGNTLLNSPENKKSRD